MQNKSTGDNQKSVFNGIFFFFFFVFCLLRQKRGAAVFFFLSFFVSLTWKRGSPREVALPIWLCRWAAVRPASVSLADSSLWRNTPKTCLFSATLRADEDSASPSEVLPKQKTKIWCFFFFFFFFFFFLPFFIFFPPSVVDDRVYIWGKSSLPDAQVSEIFFPTRLENLGSDGTKTVGVACGNFHALALTEDGTVWAWGSNARGRLGVSKGVASHEFRPVQIPLLSFRHRRVVSIGCGLHHSVFLLEDGQVFAAGCNENGQQGREAQFRQVSSHDPAPVDLPDGVRICRIASGRHHIIALSTENELFGWGKNENGQIGIPGGQDSARPVRIRHERWLETKIKMFDCGRNHTVVAMTNDTLWAFGQNVDGQLGVQSREDKSAPEQLQVNWGGGERMNSLSYYNLFFFYRKKQQDF